MRTVLIFIVLGLILAACSMGRAEINGYESCVAAGNSIMRSLPPKCVSGDGRVFAQKDLVIIGDSETHQKGENAGGSVGTSAPATPNGADRRPVCVDKCGDGVCQEMVCMAIGCPCGESEKSCPTDCKIEKLKKSIH